MKPNFAKFNPKKFTITSGGIKWISTIQKPSVTPAMYKQERLRTKWLWVRVLLKELSTVKQVVTTKLTLSSKFFSNS